MSSPLTFEHVFTPAGPSAPTLLLLHGTGGNEHDLVPLGRLMPGAHVLSPRGQVLENGMPRFFRRLAEGVFDIEDLKRRAGDLAGFVQAAADEYGFDRSKVVALGLLERRQHRVRRHVAPSRRAGRRRAPARDGPAGTRATAGD